MSSVSLFGLGLTGLLDLQSRLERVILHCYGDGCSNSAMFVNCKFCDNSLSISNNICDVAHVVKNILDFVKEHKCLRG